MAEDGYEEQILIPKEERDLAAKEGISTENGQKVTVQILNLNSGESYTGRLSITGNHQTRPRLPSPAAGYRFNPGIRGNGWQARLPQLIVVQLVISEFTEKHRGFSFGMGTRHSGQVYLPTEIQELLKESGPPAMRDLRIYGKNKLLGLLRAWLEKQIGVKARAGRENPDPNLGRVKKHL